LAAQVQLALTLLPKNLPQNLLLKNLLLKNLLLNLLHHNLQNQHQ
jgi:hypothetical protein